jgi:hypothetical protein
LFSLALLGVAATAGSGCNPVADLRTSQIATEADLAHSCQNWEQMARKAAYPDAATIAAHDRMLAKARKLLKDAAAAYDDAAARQRAIEDSAQAQSVADGMYDWRYDLSVARQCWADLDMEASEHDAQLVRLARMAGELAAAPPPSPTNDLSVAAPSIPPPAPPAPPAAAVGEQPPTAAKTWMDTPYAPLVPPVYRTEPVDCGTPAIAPVARDCP